MASQAQPFPNNLSKTRVITGSLSTKVGGSNISAKCMSAGASDFES